MTANHNDWYFDYEPLDDEHFAILAGASPRRVIAEKVPSKETARLMSAAPKMLAALKQARPSRIPGIDRFESSVGFGDVRR